MSLLRLKEISVNYGTHVLLDKVDLNLAKGMKIGLLGRNGAGKSTLLKTLAGTQPADSGERWLQPGARLSCLDQDLPTADQLTVYDVVAGGLDETGKLLTLYHQLTLAAEPDLVRLQQVQVQLEAKDGWSLGQRVETVLSQLELDANVQMESLSGGWRRRVALARALVSEPDILLLDEPTNHLDILTIEWLERHLQSFSGALIVITHDRAFLRRVANHIAELDRGQLHLVDQDFQGFMAHRELQLASEEASNSRFDKRLAEEEVWIRKGIQARRTRNEGRVRALEAMRVEREQRRERQAKGRFKLESADRGGKMVAELNAVTHRFGDNLVIDRFDYLVQRKDRIGIVGVNGAGKTTLLKILLGKLKPSEGEVKLGTRMEVVYFDQLRSQLQMDKSLQDNVCGGQTHIEINGKSKHVISYLNDFLFTPDRIRTPVKALSGGEQNRAILAILFSKPANVLVLDEPTNDLDVETLELLEEILLSFEGTVLLVSHDREFMDKVVTSLLIFEGEGRITESFGGYQDWVDRGNSLQDIANPRQAIDSAGAANSAVAAATPPPGPNSRSVAAAAGEGRSRQKLSYKEQRELAALPERIEGLEDKLQAFEQRISGPEFYAGDKAEIEQTLREMSTLQRELEVSYLRWEELDA